MCTLSLSDVIGITRHLHFKLKSFSNIVQPLHKEAVRGCSFLYIIAKKSVKMSVALLVDVSIRGTLILYLDHFMNFVESYLLAGLEVLIKFKSESSANSILCASDQQRPWRDCTGLSEHSLFTDWIKTKVSYIAPTSEPRGLAAFNKKKNMDVILTNENPNFPVPVKEIST